MPDGLEKAFNLPSLKNVSDTLRNLPDERRLRQLKQILGSAAKVKGSPEELQILLELIRLIVTADTEKLTAVKDITSNILKLVKYLPQEALKGLPLKEIVEEIRRELK